MAVEVLEAAGAVGSTGTVFNAGGPGYVLNRAALRKLAGALDTPATLRVKAGRRYRRRHLSTVRQNGSRRIGRTDKRGLTT